MSGACSRHGTLQGHRKFLSKNSERPGRPTGRWADNIKTALVYRENEVLDSFSLFRTVTTGFCKYDNGLTGSAICGKFTD
jgi:hypothetical protein